MRKYICLLLVAVAAGGCGVFTCNNDRVGYEETEVRLSDFSKKIRGYYAGNSLTVPADFDGNKFFGVLDSVYPDKAAVEKVKAGFRVKARQAGDNYSVVLCDLSTGAKLMEDFGCTLDRVDIRHWADKTQSACEFEANWQRYCQ